ncbi:MAG: hypothetical protein ACHQF4_02390 [Sphingobacteriales bacterium]|jgi:hypothetical protein
MIIWEDFELSKAEVATRHLANGGFVCERQTKSGNCFKPALNYKRTKKEQIGWPNPIPISLCSEHAAGRVALGVKKAPNIAE